MKKVLLLFFTVLTGISLYAQALLSLPSDGQVDVWYPAAIQKPIIQEVDVEEVMSGDYGQSTPGNRHWIAYSDRTDNKLYMAPSSRATVRGYLGFNEKVRIAQIENGYALVYTEPKEGTGYPYISDKAVVRGYVSMRNLLLWHSCPANEYNIYNKALLCVNLDKKQSSELGRLYGSPTDKTNYERLTTDMDFYFVMKREGNMVLLAKQHSMEGNVDRVLVGWVADGSYVPWNQRSCLEPNWDKSVVESFASSKTKYKIYHEDDRNMTGTPVVEEDFTTEIKGKGSNYMYRMMPHLLRFPILETGISEKGDTIYKCSTFGTAGSGNRNVMAGLEKRPNANAIKDMNIKELSNIDIAIVIDGTKSMGPYFQAVKEAIREAEKYFESDKFNIRVGLVIYRDYADGEENAVEVFPFTSSKNANLIKCLDEGGRNNYGFKSSGRDYSLEEALYLGIDTALEQLNFNPKHSNLMFVVGDCGNHRDDDKFNRDDIVNKLFEKRVHFMGFQVNYGHEEAFASFNTQLQYLMNRSILMKYQDLEESTTVTWDETENGYQLVNSHKSSIYVGAHYSPKQKGSVMEASKLTSLMGDAIGVVKNAITAQRNAINDVGGFAGSSFIEGVKINEEFAKKQMGEEAYELVKNGHNLLAFQGYTYKKSDGRNFYKPVLFISAQELEALLKQLSGVNAAAADANNREPYINAMRALIISVSPGMTEEQVMSTDIADVMKMVMGLNEAPDALKRYTLQDIGSSAKVGQDEYRSLVRKFTSRYARLQRISRSDYQYTYKANNMKYYWLPIEYLP